DNLVRNVPVFFLDRENVTQNLAGMLVIGQRIHRRHAGKLSEFLDVPLRIGANDRSVNHAGENAGRVFNEFPASELGVDRVDIDAASTELADADFKRNAGPSRWLREDKA